ncbi:MAG: YbbR-like domain-containing protein [Anaerolineales bacterium]|jgi:YbbR domain-containing protein
MLGSLGRNFRTFLWALVLGLAVWVAAVTAADPNEVRAYPNAVSIELVGQSPNLVITSDLPKSVQLTLLAPRSVWDQLTARPESVRVVLDLSGVPAGEHRLPLQVQVDARPVRVVTTSPSSVLLTMEPLISRTLPIQTTLSGQPAVGYQAGNLTVQPTQVVVAGPQSLVSRVARVRVMVNLSGSRESVDQDIPVEALDQNNNRVTGITVQPEAAHVSLPISRQGGFRDMAVKVAVRGQVAAGYRLDSISVFPPVVTVYSDNPDLVNTLPGVVETQPVDLDGASSNVSLRVSLDLPQGISVAGQQTVLVQAAISPIQSSFTLSGQKVQVTGLPSNLEAQISPSTVDVILAGPLPTLDILRRQDVQVTVDVSGLSPDTYQLTPNVQVLASNVTVESLLPATVEVVVSPGTGPTSQPTSQP